MTCGCCHNGGVHGLVSGHAYSLLDIKDVDYNGKTTLIKLRNPWSKEKYNGPWKDGDSKWTDARKQQVGGLTVKDDGAFWMEYKTFLRYFYNVAAAMY